VRPAALLAQPGRPVDDTVAAGVGESYIIDVQHRWHCFLIMGVLWGLVIAAAVRRRAAC
jgi:hypothetical protein